MKIVIIFIFLNIYIYVYIIVNEYDFIIYRLMEYTKCMKELGCSESLTTLTRKELINLI